jgi:hypothetical protein
LTSRQCNGASWNIQHWTMGHDGRHRWSMSMLTTSTFKAHSIVNIDVYSPVFLNIDIHSIVDVDKYSTLNINVKVGGLW